MKENTYWYNNGRFQMYIEELDALIPDAGEVNEPRKNKALEKFRVASNCYYDLYNNGLCNRASEFRQVFGIASTKYKEKVGRYPRYIPELYDHTEQVMDEIILNAVKEQKHHFVSKFEQAPDIA